MICFLSTVEVGPYSCKEFRLSKLVSGSLLEIYVSLTRKGSESEGDDDGRTEGWSDGTLLGPSDGLSDGTTLGPSEGLSDGTPLGTSEGSSDGKPVLKTVGVLDGIPLGSLDG